MSLRTKIIALVVGLGLILIAIFKFGFGGMGLPVTENQQKQNPNIPALVSSEPKELAEKKPLIFKPDQVIKLTFNTPLLNGPETKLVFDPPHEYNIEISGDLKTITITPKKPYQLGQGYTLFIKPDTKLQEKGKTLGKDYDLHFNVINYSGI